MANLAIIPARGGSKRIPKKNIKEFNGKPIITYVIDAAVKSGLFDEVMVSTDDAEITAVALANKATVPFQRSEANSNDFATLIDVILEVLENYKKQGKEFENVCCILPTAALISQERLLEGYEKLGSLKLSSLIPVIRFAYPIQRALKEDNGLLHMREQEHLRSRSQDLEPYYHDSGQFYWLKTEALLTEKTIFTSRTGFIEIKETEAQDVDTLLDWEMLTVKYNYLKSIAG
jgi:N-acylneuraminate cytidylyltransferase